MKRNPYWLTIYFPNDIAWEIADGWIRTRRTSTKKIVMRARKFSGPATKWMETARNINKGLCP
jgi:hypothetical protein